MDLEAGAFLSALQGVHLSNSARLQVLFIKPLLSFDFRERAASVL